MLTRSGATRVRGFPEARRPQRPAARAQRRGGLAGPSEGCGARGEGLFVRGAEGGSHGRRKET